MKNKIQWLLIDLDGTLITESHFGARYEFISKLILKTPRHFGLKGSLQFYPICQRVLKQYDGIHSNSDRILKKLTKKYGRTESDILKGIDVIENEIFPSLKPHFRPIPDAIEFIQWAKKHFKLVLATNPIWRIKPIHNRLGWAQISPDNFEFITHSELMMSCKPRAEYYSQILEYIKAEPSECLMIGNDRKMDGAAEKIGIDTYILSPDNSYKNLKLQLEKRL